MEDLDPEELVVCPYESAHLIRVKRMQMHIYECRKNHNNTEIGKCPFNASHVVYEAERRWHMMTCPDRHQVHSKIFQEMMSSTENRGCVETPAYRPVTMFGDSWEAPEETNQNRQQHWSPRSENASAAPVKAAPPQGATKELNPRQRRQLYLKKLAEEEERKKKAQDAEAPAGLPFRLQSSGDSQSLARFQQQTGKDVEPNIYRDTLKEPEGLTAIGRGHSGLSGRGSLPTLPPESLPRSREAGARSIADNMQSPVSAPGSRDLEDDQVTNRTDPGRYMDTEPLVRGDYGQGPGDPCPALSPAQASPQSRPTRSGSSMSLGSSPGAVECWVEEMDKVEDASAATLSESDESGPADTDVQVKSKLKKMEKKLREIATLEAKKNSGETLNADQEQKLKKKAEYEKEASLLRNLLTID